jgi:hypothetical protein
VKEVVFALVFTGRAGPIAGSTATRHAKSSAPSQALSAVLGARGVQSRLEPLAGESATLESRVERSGDGTFVEDGTITYGSAGRVSLETVGRGHVGPSPVPGWAHGGVLWSITGGDGVFAGASGLITSNFVVSAEGEVVDNHFARLYLPA